MPGYQTTKTLFRETMVAIIGTTGNDREVVPLRLTYS